MTRRMTRRSVVTGLALGAPALLSNCDRLGAGQDFGDAVLSTGEWLAYRVQRLLVGEALAREYPASAMSPDFRTNGNTRPGSQRYRLHAAQGFANWKLQVDGLVEAPRGYSLAELRAKPARTQITRHDCVEGWSAIGQWTGVPLATLLDEVRLKPDARYLVFHCADEFSGRPYYESIDLVDARHPQTILAYGMNGGALPMGHGAPIRLRVERQLGYKHAKFVMRVQAVSGLTGIGRGNGGFWEDAANYAWYAGI